MSHFIYVAFLWEILRIGLVLYTSAPSYIKLNFSWAQFLIFISLSHSFISSNIKPSTGVEGQPR
jgi:hypothetical protein